MYYVYLQEWLRVFPRHQLHIVRLEDYADEPMDILKGIFKFLTLSKYQRRKRGCKFCFCLIQKCFSVSAYRHAFFSLRDDPILILASQNIVSSMSRYRFVFQADNKILFSSLNIHTNQVTEQFEVRLFVCLFFYRLNKIWSCMSSYDDQATVA